LIRSRYPSSLDVRSLIALAAVTALLATSASAQPTPATGEAVFVVSGGGWGHGVGMPQYGAYGQANEGKTHQQILAYYYSGTELGTASSRWLRILLAEGRPTVAIGSDGPFTAQGATGPKHKVQGALALTPNLRFKGPKGPVRAGSPLVIRPGKGAFLSFDGNAYRGRFEVHRKGTRLSVINVVPLDAYLQGVVASEMPFGWPAEALRAQAVAARTYALTRVVKGKPYHLVSDVRDQVYRGIAGEKPSSNDAIRATAGKVVLHGGKLATTYYYSSSGGKTANAADVFGFAVPYLVSKPDPWDRVSPHHKWSLLIDDSELAGKLGAGGRAVDAIATSSPSGRVRALTVQTAAGQKQVEGTDARMALGLRSTYMTVGVLRLDKPPKAAVAPETPVQLTGVARGLTPVLASSSDGSAWHRLAPVRSTNGSFSVEVAPKRTMRYRLELKGVAVTPAVVVQVKPAG
jgi:stage II sporulation protein D